MKTLSLFLTVFLFSAFIITGCGKSGNETKTSTDTKTTDSKTTADTKTNTTNTSASDKGSKTLKVVPAESELKWLGKKLTGQHNGTVDISSGELYLNNSNQPVGADFTIDMKSIKVLDLTDAESNGSLTKHLKSDDFFSADKHPEGKFVSTGITSAGGNKYNVKGNLTIKGITKPIEFPATVTVDNGVAKANAKFEIDRTLWDIQFRSGKFFENLGDKTISDNFEIEFNLTAK